MSDLGKTRLGKWYWNLSDAQTGRLIACIDVALFVPILVILLLAGAPIPVAITIGATACIFVNLGIASYNLSKL